MGLAPLTRSTKCCNVNRLINSLILTWVDRGGGVRVVYSHVLSPIFYGDGLTLGNSPFLDQHLLIILLNAYNNMNVD